MTCRVRRILQQASQRCPRCHLPPRWCVCAAHRDLQVPLEIDLLLHRRECFRPSSTGRLIQRVLPAARSRVWANDGSITPERLRIAGRQLWILHPQGSPPPDGVPPEHVQVVLLDGAWSEAATMARTLAPWGRLTSLAMTGESRYWLRAQQEGGRFSTVESLLFLLRAFGLEESHEALRLQFELHVYASLRSRGRLELAEEFLRTSPAREAFPAVIAELNRPRPRE